MVVSAGASGAIFGVIGGLFYAVAVNKGRLEDLQTKQLAVMIVLSLYMGLTSSGVDNAAHVPGDPGNPSGDPFISKTKEKNG